MDIKASITILFDEDGAKIEIRDDASSITFVSVRLSPEQTCQALSRLSHTECQKCEVCGLDLVGKKMEVSSYVFEVPDQEWIGGVSIRDKWVLERAAKVCPAGWTPDLYFKSQNSFFRKDGKIWAKDTMRRWVDVE